MNSKTIKEIEAQIDFFWHEVQIQSLMIHERFAKLLGVVIEENNLGIVTEFIEGETLD